LHRDESFSETPLLVMTVLAVVSSVVLCDAKGQRYGVIGSYRTKSRKFHEVGEQPIDTSTKAR
jgi:hypothetical protein